MISELNETIVGRLLEDYFNEMGYNMNLMYEGDLTYPELQEQLILVRNEYARKITAELS